MVKFQEEEELSLTVKERNSLNGFMIIKEMKQSFKIFP